MSLRHVVSARVTRDVAVYGGGPRAGMSRVSRSRKSGGRALGDSCWPGEMEERSRVESVWKAGNIVGGQLALLTLIANWISGTGGSAYAR